MHCYRRYSFFLFFLCWALRVFFYRNGSLIVFRSISAFRKQKGNKVEKYSCVVNFFWGSWGGRGKKTIVIDSVLRAKKNKLRFKLSTTPPSRNEENVALHAQPITLKCFSWRNFSILSECRAENKDLNLARRENQHEWRLFTVISRASKWGTIKRAGNPRCAVWWLHLQSNEMMRSDL